jgi:hypothetical protein
MDINARDHRIPVPREILGRALYGALPERCSEIPGTPEFPNRDSNEVNYSESRFVARKDH